MHGTDESTSRGAVLVGLTLQPEQRYVDLLLPVCAAAADYVELAPETLWRVLPDGGMEPNAFHRQFAEFVARTGKPVVAHGVAFDLGGVDPDGGARRAAWIERVREDHRVFRFLWYTDHLGATTLAGRPVTLPIALPMTSAAASIVRERLAMLRSVVPDVGVENSVFYFLLGDWLDEPAFLGAILSEPRTHLLLDLHNVFTMGVNLGVEPRAYLERLDLASVIEIHLAGGTRSDPAWLPSGRTLRLDSHDHAIPEPVWELYEEFAPRCPNLRGVTLERMEGTVEPRDVATIEAELRRAREVLVARS